MGIIDTFSDITKAAFNPLGAVKDLLGGGKNPGKAQLAQVLKILHDRELALRPEQANALQYQKQALQSVQQGTRKALASTSRVGASAKQDVLDRGVQTQAAGQQALESRGLGNTTAVADLMRATGADTSRSLAAIDSALAGIQSNIQLQGAQSEAAANQGIAGLLTAQSGARTGLSSDIASVIAGVQHDDPNEWISQLFQLGGSLGTAAILASDRRLKANIVHIEDVDGIPVYEFDFKEGVGIPGRFRGVMAQEVAHIRGAVSRSARGHLLVNYRALPKAINAGRIDVAIGVH